MPYNRPEDRRSPEELEGVEPGMWSRLEGIRAEVLETTKKTGLPGWINGPADAFRHAFLAAKAMDLPVDAWTAAHARAMAADRRYRRDNPERAERVARVLRFYDRGGPVQVAAYTRGDGTQVAFHTSASRRV